MSLFKIARRRVPATALFYALLLATLVGMILTALLAAWMYYRLSHRKDLDQWQQQYHLEDAWTFAQAVSGEWLQEPQLFPTYADTAYISKYAWGFYELSGCQIVQQGKVVAQRFALWGKTNTRAPSLVLLDSRKPLAFSGKSQVVGDAIVPKAGISTTTVNGTPFQSGRAVTGTTTNGGGQLPALMEEWTRVFSPPSGLSPISPNALGDSIQLSFGETPVWVKAKLVNLKKEYWHGPIFIQADSLIRVGADVHLDGAVLQAPKIEIDTGFVGRLQAMAELELAVGPEVELAYPSALALRYQPQRRTSTRPRMRIDKSFHMEGDLIGLKLDRSDHFPLLSLSEAAMWGSIIWQGGLEAKGHITGHVYCDNFFYRGNGGQFYFNYMVDFIIDGPARSTYRLAPMYQTGGEKKVVQWLD